MGILKFSPIKLFLVLYCITCKVSSEKHVISTILGQIEGYYTTTREGRLISAFTSIPFAEPPVKNLRFVAPVAISPWEGVLKATQPSPMCVQRNPYVRQRDIEGQEDCLYLSIYTPYTSNDLLLEKRLLPVMVWFHGGGWMCGGSAMYGPDYILDRDVVLVTTNYRLGPLGFLSTQDKHCPGNNGLKDQQEALRFVQKMINYFGGDRNSVTIFGESAGGASVHYHMLSPSSAGLFHKAISESGVALVPWAEAPPGEAKRNAIRLAEMLGCPPRPSNKMIVCLQAKSSYDIINTEHRFYVWDYEPMTPFKAVMEPKLPGAFLTRSPRDILQLPAVPWLTGINRDEGCLKSGWITSNTSRLQEFLLEFDTIAPVTFYYENSPYVEMITKKIKDKYLTGRSPEQIRNAVLDMYTDSYFAYPLTEALEMALTHTTNSIFLYELTYKAASSFTTIFGDPKSAYVCHADDLLHLFPVGFNNNPTFKDIELSKLIVTMWTNFASSGDPNTPIKLPTLWVRTTSAQKMEYFEIGQKLEMKSGLASRSRFWSDIPLWHKVRQRTILDEL